MIKRTLEQRLAGLLDRFPCVLLYGARQAGKSTLVEKTGLAQGRKYLTFDDPETLAAARADGDAFLAQAERLTVDEVQRHPDLFFRVKRAVDRDRRPGRFLLTGSSSAEILAAGRGSALAGRAAILELGPLSLAEAGGRPPLDWHALLAARDAVTALRALPVPETRRETLCRRVMRGGLPPAWLAEEDDSWREWMRAYRALYLEKDVLPMRRLAAQDDFLRFMTQAAWRSAGILSLSDLGRDAGVPLSSAQNYLRLLEGSCQWFRVTPYHRNLGKRLVKAPKGYWRDSGVLAFLMGVAGWDEARDSGRLGSIFETWAAGELRAAAWAAPAGVELHHWRTHSGAEVDLLLSRGERLLPIEVKATESPGSVRLTGLTRFLSDHGRAAPFGMVLHAGPEHSLLGPRILAVSALAL